MHIIKMDFAHLMLFCRGKWAHADQKEVDELLAQGKPHCFRFRVPKDKVISIDDSIRGKVSWNTDSLGDFVVMRSNGLPVYNFCVAVDDATMNISHVIRAEEHLPNTLRQASQYWAFGQSSYTSIICSQVDCCTHFFVLCAHVLECICHCDQCCCMRSSDLCTVIADTCLLSCLLNQSLCSADIMLVLWLHFAALGQHMCMVQKLTAVHCVWVLIVNCCTLQMSECMRKLLF